MFAPFKKKGDDFVIEKTEEMPKVESKEATTPPSAPKPKVAKDEGGASTPTPASPEPKPTEPVAKAGPAKQEPKAGKDNGQGKAQDAKPKAEDKAQGTKPKPKPAEPEPKSSNPLDDPACAQLISQMAAASGEEVKRLQAKARRDYQIILEPDVVAQAAAAQRERELLAHDIRTRSEMARVAALDHYAMVEAERAVPMPTPRRLKDSQTHPVVYIGDRCWDRVVDPALKRLHQAGHLKRIDSIWYYKTDDDDWRKLAKFIDEYRSKAHFEYCTAVLDDSGNTRYVPDADLPRWGADKEAQKLSEFVRERYSTARLDQMFSVAQATEA